MLPRAQCGVLQRSAVRCITARCAVQCSAVQCCAPWGVGLLPRVQHGAADCFTRWGAAQDSALLPRVHCLTPQGAVWHSAEQGSAPQAAGHRSWGAAQGSAALLECSSGQCSAPWDAAQRVAAWSGAVLPGVQLRTAHFPQGCSAACCSVEQCSAPWGAAEGRASLAGCSAAWGTVLLPGAQRGAGLRVPPSTPAVFLGAEGLPPRAMEAPPGAAPHIAAAAGSSGRRVPRGQIFSLQVVITGRGGRG